jgi:hypothetical protein
VVIHAEDHLPGHGPHLFLHVPLQSETLHGWFRPTTPTPVYLFLYPRGTLLGNQPPAAEPAMFQGVVTTFNRSDNPITGQRVDGSNSRRVLLKVAVEANSWGKTEKRRAKSQMAANIPRCAGLRMGFCSGGAHTFHAWGVLSPLVLFI